MGTPQMQVLLQSGFALLILIQFSLGATNNKKPECGSIEPEGPQTREEKLAKIRELEFHTDHPNWQHKSEKVCTTDGCLDAALELLTSMNASVDPCEDFYEFACGNGNQMLRRNGYFSKFQIATFKANRNIQEILATSNKTAFKPLRDARTFYSQCLDSTLSEEVGMRPLLDLSAQLGGWPLFVKDSWNAESFNIAQSLGRFHRVYSHPLILFVTVAPDPQKSTVNRIHLDSSNSVFPEEMFLDIKKYKEAGNKYRNLFMTVMTAVSRELGKPAQTLEDAFASMLAFEIRMAKAWNKAGNSDDKIEQTTIKKLERQIDSMRLSLTADQVNEISILEFMKEIFATSGVQIDENERLIVTHPKALKELLRVVMTTPKSTIANYIQWRQTILMMPLLNQRLADIKNDGSGLRNEYMCSELTMATYWPAVTRRYLQTTGARGRKQVEQMTKHLLKTLGEFQRGSIGTFRRPDSDETLDLQNPRVLKEVKNMKKVIGFPDWILNRTLVEEEYANLQLGRDLPTSYANMMNWHGDRQLRKLRAQPSNHKEDLRIDYTENLNAWTISPAGLLRTQPYPVETNISAVPSERTIFLPAGVLRPPFFNPDWPKYMNYGRLGYLVGLVNMRLWEFFRDQIVFEGNILERAIFMAYTSQCFVEQYNSFEPLPGLRIDGARTLPYSSANQGAMLHAAPAYIRWLTEDNKNEPEDTLPGLERLSGSAQLFFLSFANLFCQNNSPEIIRGQVEDNQIPLKYNVNGVLQNLEEFAVAFQCPAGSKMNRGEQRCKTA